MSDAPDSVLWLLGGLGTASLAVLGIAVSRIANGQPALETREQRPETLNGISSSIACAWVAMALYSAVTTSSAEVSVPAVSGIISSVVFNALLFGIVFLPMVISDGRVLQQFGFRRDCWQEQLGDGVLGFLASLAPVGLVFGLTVPFRTQENGHALLRLLESDQSFQTVFWICVSAAVMAPLVEELIYRVVIQTWLEQHLPPRVALVVAAAVFSAVHRFPDALPLFPLAIVLGYLYQQRRSYLSIVVVHALFNATNLAVLLLSLQDAG